MERNQCIMWVPPRSVQNTIEKPPPWAPVEKPPLPNRKKTTVLPMEKQIRHRQKHEEQDKEERILEAVCIQHEIDHLNGVTLMDREHKREPLRVSKKWGRNEIVPITDRKTYKEIKYKKALPLIESGKWEIYVPANAEIYETQE